MFPCLLVKMYERIFSTRDHRDKAKCIHLIGKLNVVRRDDHQALLYFREARRQWKSTLVINHPDLRSLSQGHCSSSVAFTAMQHQDDSNHVEK